MSILSDMMCDEPGDRDDDEICNDDRAEMAREAVDVFAQTAFCDRTFTDEAAEGPDGDTGDAHDMIMDLIGNLCHLAERHKWDVDLLVKNAVATYKEERDEEAADLAAGLARREAMRVAVNR